MKKCRHNIENSLIVSERITNLAEHNDHDEDQTDHQDGYQDQDVGPAVKYSGYTEGINLISVVIMTSQETLYFSPPRRVF